MIELMYLFRKRFSRTLIYIVILNHFEKVQRLSVTNLALPYIKIEMIHLQSKLRVTRSALRKIP